jgi:hypothetical protein
MSNFINGWSNRRFYVLLLGGWMLFGGTAFAAWQAGVARVDITPTEPIWLGGYGAHTHPSEGIRQHIFVKALALVDDQGHRLVLVSSDLLGFPCEVADPIAARVEKQFGIPRERLILNSSHTHSAPAIGHALNLAYPYGDADRAVILRYTDRLEDQVVATVGRSLQDLQPAELSFEQGLAGVAVNRRRVGHREYPGPVDQDVPVLAVRGVDGRLRAIVFGYACHNTVLNDYQVSGDWAGYAQAALETAHPEAQAMFIQDCGADANPLPRRSVELAQGYGQIIAAAVEDVLGHPMRPVRGPAGATLARVDLPLEPPPSRAELESRLSSTDVYKQRHARLMLQVLDRDGKLPDRYPYPIEVWQFGKDLTFIVLGGEVVADYALRFKHQYGVDDVWVAGYSNDVFAYIPSRRVRLEGGYEGSEAMIVYGLPAPFTWAVEEVIAEKVDELVKQLRGE